MNRYLLFFLLILSSGVIFLSCAKERSFETGDFLKAKGSLQDSLRNCYTANVNGNYYAGVTLTAANKVDIQVNVKTAGNYTIATDTMNGFVFKASGSFSSTGVQSIQLSGTGKPLLAQATVFTISFDSTVCSFTVNVTDSTGGGGGGSTGTGYLSDTAWKFSENVRSYHGSIDTAFVFDTTYFGLPAKILNIQGSTPLRHDSIFLVSVLLRGTTITPGTYPTTTSGIFQFLGSPNLKDTLYSATPLIPSVVTTIDIQSYNTTTKVIKGLFSGTAKNKTNNTVNISSGKFEAKVD